MKDFLRISIIVITGLLTFLLMNILPIAGGGSSLIFVLTVPVTSVISLFMIIYFFLRKRYKWSQIIFDLVLVSAALFSLFVSIAMFPYK